MQRSRASTLLVILAYTGFVSLGLPDGLLGVASPSIRATFALAPTTLAGCSSRSPPAISSRASRAAGLGSRRGAGALLAVSCRGTAVTLLGDALAPAWSVMLGFAVLAGLGAGAIDAGLNTCVAIRFSARTVNWLHAFYGVGAATGPVVMTAVLATGRPWRAGYAIIPTSTPRGRRTGRTTTTPPRRSTRSTVSTTPPTCRSAGSPASSPRSRRRRRPSGGCSPGAWRAVATARCPRRSRSRSTDPARLRSSSSARRATRDALRVGAGAGLPAGVGGAADA